ncbi:propionyl-CoA synthetase [Gammaproteobacteria bacterium]|nr:propionyl-CoA synthetase [Gammaproteobacteria bacterium]
MSYEEEYKKSIEDPAGFWSEKAGALDWYKKTDNVLSTDDDGIYHWFPDWELNTSYMALDYHVKNGRGDQAALIYDSPVTDTKKTYTYNELLAEVEKTAGMIASLGIAKGDTVVIYMPMIPQAAIAMLACARIGAIHSVVFGGFASAELAVRIDDAKPKLILSASCGIEITKVIDYKVLLDKAIDLAKHKVGNCLIYQREQFKADLIDGRDLDWQGLLASATPHEPVSVKGIDPLYILYTSGTTGKPKGVVRENGGHAVAMKYSMNAVYDTDPGEVYFAASDVGWVVGHSYIVYGPLLQGCTTIFYEGKPIMTPDAGAFWRVISEHKVKTLFTAPTAYRAIKKEDPNGELTKKYDLSSLVNVFSAGERLDAYTYQWINDVLGVPVVDNWWQTETGWAIASNLIGIEVMETKPGSATMPSPGFAIEILDDEGNRLENDEGNIAIKLPLPPSCLATIWGDTQRFVDGYLSDFPGYYTSGDGGYFDEDGYLFVMGRTDDVINVAGHRLSTGEIEECISSHPDIAECAVIGSYDDLKGQIPVGFIVLKANSDKDDETISKELVSLVRDKIGPIVCYKDSHLVKRLPKTRSGKILRKTIKAIVDGNSYTVPATIDDPTSLDEIKDVLA